MNTGWLMRRDQCWQCAGGARVAGAECPGLPDGGAGASKTPPQPPELGTARQSGLASHTRRLRKLLLRLVPATAVVLHAPARAGDPAQAASRAEVLERAGGERVSGRLSSGAGGFMFTAAGSGTDRSMPLEPGMVVRFDGPGPPRTAGLPPFRVALGLDQRISGRLASIDETHVVLLDALAPGPFPINRAGVQSLVQRPGETLVLLDGFETLDRVRWTIVGEPGLSRAQPLAGEQCLNLPANGSALTYHVAEPFAAGRLEVAFHDLGRVVAGHKWFVDLTFRGPDPETVRAVLGWSEESLAVESVGGPALAIQRLARPSGWHRLVLRFGADRCEVSIDGNELAHGKGFDGPLVEVRLATSATDTEPAPPDLAGQIDDLRLVRFSEPVGSPEVDVSQDEVRLTSGDQVFGHVTTGTGERFETRVDDRVVPFSWSGVAGVYFRRDAKPGALVSGLLVRAEWRSAPGREPADLDCVEGALTAVSPTTLSVATPYAGVVAIPRERMASLVVISRGARLVIDPSAHHLGDEISTMPPMLDPPQPEGGVLERGFELPALPEQPVWLVLDVVQVVGEGADQPFSAVVKKGELRTNVSLNGTPFDYINHYIFSRNETPERIRLPIPKRLLRAGRNIVRLDQVGIASDPNYLDDLGVLGIALESGPAPPAPRRD